MRRNEFNAIRSPEVTLRIPGSWAGPEEFMKRLPRGCRCTEETLVLADGSEFELNVLPADDEFPGVIAGSCTRLRERARAN
jgi:hypothetical protein